MTDKPIQKTIYRPEYEEMISFLKKIREERGLSQSEVGMILGQDQTYVSKYETGIRRIDLLETMDICDVLEVSMIDLITLLRGCDENKTFSRK